VNDGRIIDCNITDLTVPTPCQVHPDDSDFGGRLALNDARTLLFGAYRYDNSVTVFDVATNTKKADIFTGVSAHGLAVDPQIGNTYVSDYSTRGRLFVIDREGKFTAIDLSTLGVAFGVPGQVEVDETNGRIYIISPNSLGGAAGISPFIALDRETRELGGILEPDEWTFGQPGTLGIDEGRNLLYLSASSNRLLVFDGAKFFENTRVNDTLVANIVIGREDGTELAGGVAVDVERNLIYVAKYGYLPGCDPCRNALVVLRGSELDNATRTVLRAPEVVAEVPGIGLNYDGGPRNIALDLDRNLIYVAGELEFGLPDITVLDGFKIVDAQGQVTSNPAAAILGFIPI